MNYATSDGNIWVDVFRYRAISRDRQGGLYVGGHRGFIHIQSGSVSLADKIQFSPIVTDVKIQPGFFGPQLQKYRNIFFIAYLFIEFQGRDGL